MLKKQRANEAKIQLSKKPVRLNCVEYLYRRMGSYDGLILVCMVMAWYGSSMLSATSSKQLLVGGPQLNMEERHKLSPLELTCLQMWIAAVFAGTVSIVSFNGNTSQLFPKGNDAMKKTIALAIVFSTGFITLNLAYDSMSTSLANTLRAAEPLSSLLLAYANAVEPLTVQIVLSVAVIVLGASLASYGNAQFTYIGLFYCILANFAFAYRTIQYRDIRNQYKVDHATLFCQTCFFSGSILSVFLLASMCLTNRFYEVVDLVHDGTPEFWWIAFMNGLTFFMYLQLSFATLTFVSVVTHAILNSFRRPAVILFDVLVFQTRLSFVNITGIAMACMGVTVYSILKARKPAAPLPNPATEPRIPAKVK